jgi:hypothetical protein
MISKEEVEQYLNDFKIKLDLIGIIFRDDRGKNAQTLSDLEITPDKRLEIIKSLEVENYSEGPLEEKLYDLLPMWVFGKNVKSKEVYIKISMAAHNAKVICISFHIAECKMKYPFRR